MYIDVIKGLMSLPATDLNFKAAVRTRAELQLASVN